MQPKKPGDDMFDTNRSADHIRNLQGRTDMIADFGALPLRIDETGENVSAPLRMTTSSLLGTALELGPFSLSVEDAAQLHTILDAFLTRAHWAAGTSDQAG